MAAAQQKKRLISSSFSSPDHHHHHNRRGTKKKHKHEHKDHHHPPDDHQRNLRPHVALEWDDARGSAVARKDQVGITWRDLSPFLNTPPPQPHAAGALADVLSVPEDMFRLQDLTAVLSYGVWESCLSESERRFLTQFLPDGSHAHDVVYSLLQGDNFHFGNPFHNWGSSLCSGNLHPDLIMKHKKNIKDMKKNYYFGLRIYHNQIIESILTWKERWTSCRNPEKEIVEKLWRKRATTTSPTSPDVSERMKTISTFKKKMTHEYFSFEDDTKYMSYFKVSKRQHQMIKKETHCGDEILSNTLNRVLGDIEDFSLQPYVKFEEEERRSQHEHWLKLVYDDLPIGYECFKERGALRRQWRYNVTQQLSELEDVKNYSSDHIDDEENGNVQLSTTEQDNAVQYLSDEDLHQNKGSSYNFHNNKCQSEIIPSLNARREIEFEVADHGRNLDDISTTIDSPADQLDVETTDIMKLSSIEKNDSAACHLLENMPQSEDASNLHIEEDHLKSIPSLNTCHEVEILDVVHDINQDRALTPVDSPLDRLKVVEVLNLGKKNSERETTHPDTIQLERLPSLNSHQDPKTVTIVEDEGKNIDYNQSRSSVGPLYFGNIKEAAHVVKTESSGCSAREMWTEESVMNDYCASQRSHMYNSNDDLSHKQPQTVPQIINMETNTLVGHASEPMLSLAVENGTPFFNQYANQQHNMLLPTFPKEQTMLPAYSNEHLDTLKGPELPFIARNGCLPQPNSSSHHFQGREMMLDHSHTRQKEHFLNLMSSNNRYPNLSQGPSGEQDWFPYSSSTNDGLTGQEMFPSEFRRHNSWSDIGPSGNISHCLGNERSTDGSLYSVLPEYSKAAPSYPCNNSLSHLTHASSYLGNEIYNSGNLPSSSFSYRMIPGRVGNLNSRDAVATAAPLKAGGLSWMNAHQNPNGNDLIGKTYLRSWNQ